MKKLLTKFEKFFKKDDPISRKIFKNVILSFGVKGGSIFIGLLLVPLTIGYVSPIIYGIWLTMSSIVTWVSFFDVGLGNGLRNKLTNSLATNKLESAKTYVSTTYAVLALISLTLFTVFYFVNQYVDWQSFLNVPSKIDANLRLAVLIVFGSFCIQFTIQLVNTVLTAIHEPATAGVITFIGQLAVLLAILTLKKFVPGTLEVLVSVLTFIPLIVMLVSSLFLYNNRLRDFRPSLQKVDFGSIKDIFSIGSIFFLIQIGALVLFQTDNIIIVRTLGPEHVTEFNVAYKLFSIISMIFTIIVTPYWSAFTAAFAKQDYDWLRRNVVIMKRIWIFLSAGAIVLLGLSPWLFRIWLGDKVTVNISLSIAMVTYVIIFMWQTIHVYFLNGIGKVRLQLILVSISAIINVPLAIFLGKKFGLSGIISANSIVFLVMSIFFTVQTRKILAKSAKGIWNL